MAALAVGLTACGGDGGNGGDGSDVGKPVKIGTETYTVEDVTVAETAEELEKATGGESDTGFTLSGTAGSGDPAGTYVAVRVEIEGREDSNPLRLIGGDGSRHTAQSFTIGFDLSGGEAKTEGGTTFIFDVPPKAVEGAHLDVGGQAIDLGL